MKFDCACDACSKGYFWNRDGELWVEIPKNASSSIKLKPSRYIDLPARDGEAVFPRRFNFPAHRYPGRGNPVDQGFEKGWAVLREPVDRFKSLLAHYFLGHEGRRIAGKEWLHSLRGCDASPHDLSSPACQRCGRTAGRAPCQHNICDFVLENWASIHTIGEPHHFSSQASFIPPEFFKLDYRFYDMGWAREKFATTNASSSSLIEVSEKNVVQIRHLYIDDVELWEKFTNERNKYES